MTITPSLEQTAVLALLASPGSAADKIDTVDWPAVNWNYIFTSIDTNVFPYLHFACESRGIESLVPIPAWEKLTAARQATRLQHLRWTSEIKQIAREFNEMGIPCLLLKGADLKFRLYSDPSTRPIRDLDMLIEPRHFPRAQHALRKVGYQPLIDPLAKTPGPSVLENQIESENSNQTVRASKPKFIPFQAVKFVKQIGKWSLGIDLKCEAEPTPSGIVPDWESRWKRSLPNQLVPEASIRVLHPSDLLAQLSIHLIYHHGCISGLLWLLDIRLLLERWHDEIDWGQFEKQSKSAGSASAIALALHLSSRLLGARRVGNAFANVGGKDEMDKMFDLVWQQMFFANLKARPPYPFSGSDPRKVLSVAIARVRNWTSREWTGATGNKLGWNQVPGLLFDRLKYDLKVYRTAWAKGSMTREVIAEYKLMDQRTARLRDFLSN